MSKLDTTHERIKDLRIKRGMSQDELAERAGYKSGRAMICQIEAGKVNLPLDKLKAIAEALDVTSAYLAGYEDSIEEEELACAFYRTLNAEGKKIALEYLRMLSNNPVYTNLDKR